MKQIVQYAMQNFIYNRRKNIHSLQWGVKNYFDYAIIYIAQIVYQSI